MNAEGEHPAAPSCAPSTTPSSARATAVASAAESAAPQARPIASFFQREEASVAAAAAASTAAPLLLQLAQQQVPMSRQPPSLSSLLLRRSQWHAQTPRKGQDVASPRTGGRRRDATQQSRRWLRTIDQARKRSLCTPGAVAVPNTLVLVPVRMLASRPPLLCVSIPAHTFFFSHMQVPVASRHKFQTSFLPFCEFCRCVCCLCPCFFRTYGVYHMISYCCTNIERLHRMHTDTCSTGRTFFSVCVASMSLSFYTGMFSTWVRDQEDQQQWSFCCTAVSYAGWPVIYCCFPANFQPNYTSPQRLPSYRHLCVAKICRKGCPRRRQTIGIPVPIVPASIVRT